MHILLTYIVTKGWHDPDCTTIYTFGGRGAGEMAHSSRAHNLEEDPSSVPVTHIRRLALAVTAAQLFMQATLYKRKSFSCVSPGQQGQASPQPQMPWLKSLTALTSFSLVTHAARVCSLGAEGGLRLSLYEIALSCGEILIPAPDPHHMATSDENSLYWSRMAKPEQQEFTVP